MNTIQQHGINVSVSVNGRPARVYSHEGKFFVESREGTQYSITVKNDNYYRVEAVVTVDGLSVLSGKPAALTDSGYIIGAWSSVDVKGYRNSTEDVGAFKFTNKHNSYVKDVEGKKGVNNVGVIGIAIYRERAYTYTYTNSCTTILNGFGTTTPNWNYTPTIYTCGGVGGANGVGGSAGGSLGSTTNSSTFYNAVDTHTKGSNSGGAQAYSCSLNSKSLSRSVEPKEETLSFDHGTTWGEKLQDKVVMVNFERESGNPFTIFEIYYNSKAKLEALGIKLIQEKTVSFPSGFPKSFAHPPVDWKG